jgi:alpha-glucosidase (family GH31 glycosyl hydrolase)
LGRTITAPSWTYGSVIAAVSLLVLGGVIAGVSTGARPVYTIVEDPVTIGFVPPLPQIAALDGSAFYIWNRDGTIPLVGPPIERTNDGTDRLVYRTTDGRPATVRIGTGPEGTTRIEFSVSEVAPFEKLGVSLRVGKNEGFYGLMERVVHGSQGLSWEPGMTEALNLRGQTVDLYTLPTVSVYAPFFLSSNGYGVYVETDWPGVYRFGIDAEGRTRPEEITIEVEGPTLSLLLLPGPMPIDVIERYARITGPSLLPPDFLFGPGRWRDVCWDLPAFYDGTAYDGPYNSMLVEDVLMMEALGIPCSWIVVDRPWASGTFGYGDMTFDEARFPAFDSMIDWLDRRGIASLLWLGPWVMDGQRDMAIERGYHVPLTIPYLPNAALIDFTNPEAAAWWKAELDSLFASGIAGFKLDRGEEKPPDGQLFRGTYYDGTDYREGHNAYPLWFAQAVHDAAEEAGIDDFVSFYRAGWPGMSQVAAAWGGDTDPSAWGLRSAIVALQRAAVLNVPIWGSDTGGYNTRPTREVLARWLAFSAFCPIMEVGPTANLAPWSWLPDVSTDELDETGYTFDTVYDEELLAIWALYAQIHVDLIEYVYTLAEAAHEHGTPIVRPMFVAYPDRAEYVDLWDQYLYGPNLLVRPVWEPGIESVDVHLPEGMWVDMWTGMRYSGPSVVSVDVPLHLIPVFVQAGAPIDLGDLPARWRRAVEDVAVQPDLAALAGTVR